LKDKDKKDKKQIRYLLIFIYRGSDNFLILLYFCKITSGPMENLNLNFYLNYELELFTISSFLPINLYKDLSRPEEFKVELNKVGGVYEFIHLPDNKQYIGSSSNIYKRLNNHLKGISFNIRLQRATSNSGLNNLNFVVYYFHNNPNILLTDVETEVIKSFPFENLYNFKKEVISMLNYKHTAIEKIKKKIY
jgi:hypothetical protein